MSVAIRHLTRATIHTLQLAERRGERCGGPILLAGLVLGLGVVELSSGSLGQTSRFSLELLILLVLQLAGPMLVALIAMALLLPEWLEPSTSGAGRSLMPSLAASGLLGGLLLLLMLMASVIGGVLASPRADLMAEFSEVLNGVMVADLLRSTLRSAFFLAVLCGWSQIRAHRHLLRNVAPARVSSDLLVEGLLLLLGLKLFWIVAIDPLHITASAQ